MTLLQLFPNFWINPSHVTSVEVIELHGTYPWHARITFLHGSTYQSIFKTKEEAETTVANWLQVIVSSGK